MQRNSVITRKTNETKIALELNIDGKGQYSVDSPVAFLNHMIELFSKHGLFDIKLNANGDINVDYHHTVEDIGICMGQAFREALGKKERIKRYGFSIVPMDEALARAVIDISGRPSLSFSVTDLKEKTGSFDVELIEEFFKAFVSNSFITLHIEVLSGSNSHHVIEAIFKAFARALDEATLIDPRLTGIPSTKGVL